MKKLFLILLIAALALILAACEFMPQLGTTDASASTTTASTPVTTSGNTLTAPLTVLSCSQVSFINGERTYRLTFSDGSTANFKVKDGQNGESPTTLTVKSCTAVSTVDDVTTWRITFSDNSTADFTVTNAAPLDADVDWEELLKTLEEMTEMLSITEPDFTVGSSTVTDTTKTAAPGSAHSSTTITGWAFPVNKSVMFGTADTVHAIRLNKFKAFSAAGVLLSTGDITIEVQFRAFDSTNQASKSTLVKSYTVTVPADSSKGYYDLPITVKKSDLAAIGDNDYFLMVVNIISAEGHRLAISTNSTYFYIPTERLTKQDGSQGAYLYTGYVTGGTAEKVPSDAHSNYTPDVFFCTATKSTPIDLSALLQGGGSSGDGSLPEMNVENLLQLPAQYDLVVGDNFELFYKGITLCINSDAFDYELRFSDGKSRGNNYSKKYVWCPTADDVGVYTLSITVRDDYGRALDTETVKLNVVKKPATPDDEKVYLFIGDSLSSSGTWPKEIFRRLTTTSTTAANGNAAPKGDGISNIKTIGTLKTGNTASDVFYEGYGGWSAASYTTAYASRPYFVYIHGTFDPDNLTQHACYSAGKDAKGNDILWKLEHITATKIKLIAVNASGNVDTGRTAIAASGTLTLASGGQATDTKTLTYTSTSPAEGNPFWNLATGKNDFKAYAAKHGVDKIDEAVILLGWNNTTTNPATLEADTRKLVEDILADYPNCHITLVGLQLPSRDGFSFSYGIGWNYYEKISIMFDICNLYESIASDEKYAGSVSYVSVAGQFDAENCYDTKNVAVNNRVTTTEALQSNGVHPSTYGYYQIADAVYRHLVTRLQGK